MSAYLADPAALARRVGSTATDPDVEDALRRASDRFASAVGYPLHRVEDDVVDLSGTGSTILPLPARPVIGDVVVEVDGQQLDDFQVNRRVGFLRRTAGWPTGEDNIRVTYTHGNDPIPGDVADVVVEQAEALYRARPGVATLAAGTESVTFSKVGTTEAWATTVETHRRGVSA